MSAVGLGGRPRATQTDTIMTSLTTAFLAFLRENDASVDDVRKIIETLEASAAEKKKAKKKAARPLRKADHAPKPPKPMPAVGAEVYYKNEEGAWSALRSGRAAFFFAFFLRFLSRFRRRGEQPRDHVVWHLGHGALAHSTRTWSRECRV